MRLLLLSLFMTLALGAQAQAACYADYKTSRVKALASISSDTEVTSAEARAWGNRAVLWGIAAIVVVLLAAAVLLFLNLPDANAFNNRVERLFVEQDFTTQRELRLLEVL